MLQEIQNHSDKKELKSEDVPKYIPLFYYPVGLALFLLLIATSSMSRREKVHLPSAFILFVLLFNASHVEAGMLDFMQLDAAKKAYEAKEYKKSQAIYDQFAKSTNSSESYYDSANALYKLKQYDKAIENYKKAKFSDKNKEANSLSNLGNAYAKKGDEKSLHAAVKQYEKSLKLKEDQDTRENLEAVKKLLQKKQNKQKKQDKNKNKSNKNKNNKKDNKKDNKKNQDQKNRSGNDKKNQNSQEKQKQDQNEKNRDSKNKNSQSKKEDKKKKSHEQKKNESDKKGKQKDEQSKQTQAKEQKMSDAEEKKWMHKLNTQHKSYMYKIGKQIPIKENSDEKPW